MSPLHVSVDSAGYWGPPTSTLDWCERNYEVSPFVAEFWNTISNMVMIFTALRGSYDVHTQGFEKRFHFCFASLFVVGIGSWMFHMTLQYEMQMLDELPMVWGGLTILYCMCVVQSKRENEKLACYMTTIASVFTIAHLYLKIPSLLFATYGSIVFITAVLDIRIMQSQYSSNLIYFYCVGFFVQIMAVILWFLDNLACDQLEALRRGPLTAFLGPLTQLHGWWHALAGYATYMHIVFCICHRQYYLNKGRGHKGCAALKPHVFFGYTLKMAD